MSNEQELYVSNITANYVAKNKFEKEVCDSVKRWGYVFTDNKEKFLADLAVWVKGIHNKYPRCGALSVTMSRSAFKGNKHYIRIGAILIQIELVPVILTALYNAPAITLKQGFNLELLEGGDVN